MKHWTLLQAKKFRVRWDTATQPAKVAVGNKGWRALLCKLRSLFRYEWGKSATATALPAPRSPLRPRTASRKTLCIIGNTVATRIAENELCLLSHLCFSGDKFFKESRPRLITQIPAKYSSNYKINRLLSEFWTPHLKKTYCSEQWVLTDLPNFTWNVRRIRVLFIFCKYFVLFY